MESISSTPSSSAEQVNPERAKCNEYVEKGLQHNPTIQFLFKKLIDLGCKPPEGFIRCVDCGSMPAGGGFGMVEETIIDKGDAKLASGPRCELSFSELQSQMKSLGNRNSSYDVKVRPEIFLCQNNMRGENHAHLTMAHELIHAIDMCRTNMDPLRNCIQMACTEIRAENLSGECDYWSEAIAGRIESFPKHGQLCVKRRAALSLKANPNCKDKASEYIDAAFHRCYEDTFPFDRHPNLR